MTALMDFGIRFPVRIRIAGNLFTLSRHSATAATVPSQGRFLLNNYFVMRVVDAAAGKLLEAETTAERVHKAFVRF